MGKTNTSTPNSEVQIPESLTFEQALTRADEIVRLLEKGDAPLDKSLALFEEGAKLIRVCGKMLDEAEQKVVRLQKGEDGEPEESLFDDE
jgi:exodeoxyribonuclease VII small subunit